MTELKELMETENLHQPKKSGVGDGTGNVYVSQSSAENVAFIRGRFFLKYRLYLVRNCNVVSIVSSCW